MSNNNRSISNLLNGLSLLRVISVTMILLVHFGQSVPMPDFLHIPIVWCRHGVQMFYLLSGFLIYASLSKKTDGIWYFYKKRIVRIIPIYFTVIVINIILFDCILDVVPDDSMRLGWLRYFLFLQTMVPSESVEYWNNISALWTMSAFALFYLVAPFLQKISKRGVLMCLVCIVLLYVAGRAASAFYNNMHLSDEFANSLHYINNKNAVSQLWIFAVGGGIFVLKDSLWAKYIYFMAFAIMGLVYHNDDIVMVCCFAVIISAIGQVNFKPSDKWCKIWNTLDEYSFSIYLGHTTIIELMGIIRDIYHLNMFIVGVGSIGGSILLVWSLHNLIERPVAIYFKGR